MKNIILLVALTILIFGCKSNQEEKSEFASFFMPEEYCSHEAVWLGWEEFIPYHQPFIDIAKVLIENVPLKIIAVDSSSLVNLKNKLTEKGFDTLLIDFYLIKDNPLWMRDHGATYLINKEGQKKVVDFGWTFYGFEEYLTTYYEGNKDSVALHYKRKLGRTGQVDSIMGTKGGYSSIKTDLNMEGGSIEVNGKGTLILCEAVTMQRNPILTKGYIESEFKRTLGMSNIIWMKKGLVEDPFLFNQIFDGFFGWGTYGHTDEFVRFVNDSTILLAWVDESEKDLNDFNKINYRRMSENLSILQNSKDQNGNPFNIIKVPLPDPIYFATEISDNVGSINWTDRSDWKIPISWLPKKDLMQAGDNVKWVAASSYLNYLVTNNVVLLPSYTNEGSSLEKEKRVKEIFTKVFPQRELVFLDVIKLNYFGGGIHCVTQQEPKLIVSKNDANTK